LSTLIPVDERSPADSAATASPTFDTVRFRAGDYHPLNLKHLLPAPGPTTTKGPVLIVGGTGVRANLFNPPTAKTLPQMLHENGFDVWILNWRSSIDLPAVNYTLDDAAVQDMPFAVKEVIKQTGADAVKAVIHCQGSCAFMMAITAGLIPGVSVVVSNSVALHPILPRPARIKLLLAVGVLNTLEATSNAQWGIYPPGFWPKVLRAGVLARHHECDNTVCKQCSFMYGRGFPTLWRHENLNDATHEWIKGEFGQVPMTWYEHLADAAAAGEWVSTGKYPELPPLYTTQAPRTEARFVFMTGDRNQAFLPEGMGRTFEYFDRYAPGRHTFQKIPGYGHLDVFLGKNAHEDVFPFIIDELSKPW
jgi:hypothetical protein